MEIEWWVSKDGFSWQRPFRGSSNLDALPLFSTYFMHPPIEVNGELRWFRDDDVYAIKKDRMFYLNARHNTELVTKEFILSNPGIQLNVEFGSPQAGRQGPLFQGYVMAELISPDGKVIPGCEPENCLHHASKESILNLTWESDKLLKSYIGKPVKLRLYMRDVKLYALE